MSRYFRKELLLARINNWAFKSDHVILKLSFLFRYIYKSLQIEVGTSVARHLTKPHAYVHLNMGVALMHRTVPVIDIHLNKL